MVFSVDEKIELVKRNLQEVISEEELETLLKKKKSPSLYWGTMPTGSVSFAYFFPMLKLADFLKAGFKVKILLADLHAALDGVPWDLLEKRYKYYERAITLILKSLDVDLKNLEFVKGSAIQMNEKYFNDVLKLSTLTSISNAKHSASEAVKTAQGDVKLSGLIYPLMQALDEEYLGVDAQFAGLDQRKILVFAREFLPKIGYKPRVELMVPMIRGLVGKQMSSSVESSKIDLLNDEKTVIKKINAADFAEGNPENGLMDIVKYLILVIKGDKGEKLLIERSEKYGGNLSYGSYEELERDVLAKKIHPLDLKNAVAKEINL
ncbi:MAG: tyrosine--tRNA ligase, partial [Nanoarchaeota archaeon]|nr:tyrosine--tRNA ligase [Nanoarchaeota archaeon]MBU1501308.1 tyrosine--tRNA ligase [Nanoarchaeota archaeon]